MTYIEQRLESLERLVERLQERIDELENSVFPEKRIEAAPELISMAEAARLAGLHRNTIYLWVKEGRLEAVRSNRSPGQPGRQAPEAALGGHPGVGAAARRSVARLYREQCDPGPAAPLVCEIAGGGRGTATARGGDSSKKHNGLAYPWRGDYERWMRQGYTI